ncbi:hypothetical protein A2334_00165 [Candidatus Roizmanbacteria bacterium RIFOXYB2_FULL_38_10]|uniref:ZIP family metal transporter n=1 Tax=Candidatus Roizmanbacteria bacterium RIFOXYD1_FULL_38_12 TaxID=1802093 RepID=A0A1F7L255_9BACT|nr:MAG: hypothetical protein A3K47_05710 [Candidatus Roizmanbacteria bacterium RIFOXYA2_FULL_38_14]OGK64239.1 MAG: hypothetical protein A3K27_05710 [Candidatus Roizmanbacteria bacterium RIFOXYA1_FULL_37_12]OGK66085.1 MAG: hypothetical protein A3K38_05710 [Candidatus Roizmanbacteria bacterium RIFOXYB1_FULL_40_23]OGK67650.1 MAG: hypothetical protein A2334_00165 [Candidatus Roizmanbacteria bacterium RIFOXYB2_FULL_38_10]OGK70490.1 MAG: hypothetical protein A3K21_05715 [Candidatus Roizmanbacteria ba
MNILFSIILANLVVSAGSLIGVITLVMKEKTLHKILILLVSLSAGALIGGAFLHLLPEAQELYQDGNLFLFVLLSFIFFFILEKLLHWRHCHKGVCKVHTFGLMNLIGDSIHNFIDGLVIAASFLTSFHLGVVTTLAVALHEIPQEIGDFGVLLYAGFGRKKALFANFMTALTAVFGGVIGYFAASRVEHFTFYLLPVAAGGFIYIATTDLIPEMRKETNLYKSFLSFLFFILGIIIMYLAKFIEV